MSELINTHHNSMEVPSYPNPTFTALFSKFQRSLNQKSINFGVNGRQATPTEAYLTLALFLPLRQTHMEVECKVKGKWIKRDQLMQLSISFRFSRLAGRPLVQLGNRTRMELVSSIGEINKYLRHKKSCLTMSSYFFDSFVLSASWQIITTGLKEREKLLEELLGKALSQFIKYIGQLNDVKFFQSPEKMTDYSSLRQLLQTLYITKTQMFRNSYSKPDATINTCLTLMANRVIRHNRAFRDIEKSNRIMNLINKEGKSGSKDSIAHAIKIKTIEDPHPVKLARFTQNLKKNNASACEGIVSLKKTTFQLRKSFGILRQGKKDNILPLKFQNREINTQHIVIKKCINTHLEPTPIQEKSKIQSGHESEHNFLMINGNLSSMFIGKYYLDLEDARTQKIAHRKIMTRFQEGDLMTEVAYNTHHDNKEFSLMEYLTIFEQLALAISFLHENRVLHRDIKPTNILFKYQAYNRFICKLIDFGSCYVCREQSCHLFNPKIYTTPGFNLTFRKAQQLTDNEIGRHFTQEAYEVHELYDIHGIAATMEYLLKNSFQRYSFQLLNLVLKICMNPNPSNRFTPDELIIIIRRLKIALLTNDPIHILLGNSQSSPSQNN